MVVTFGYNVADTLEDNVTVTSDSSVQDAITLELDGVETGPGSNVFMSTVALFSADDYAKISDAVDELEDDAAITDYAKQQLIDTATDTLDKQVAALVKPKRADARARDYS